MDTPKLSAYARMCDEMSDFMAYNSLTISRKSIRRFFSYSIGLCKTYTQDDDYPNDPHELRSHLEYLKSSFPELYFICMLYFYKRNTTTMDMEITENDLDDYCYAAFTAISERLLLLNIILPSTDTVSDAYRWITSYTNYVSSFFTLWWSDVASHLYDATEITTGIGELHSTEFDRAKRVFDNLVTNGVPFQSVVVGMALEHGLYGEQSGTRYIHINNHSVKVSNCDIFRHKSGIMGDAERYARLLCDTITQDYIDNEAATMLLWSTRLAKTSNVVKPSHEIIVSQVIITTLVFHYLNSNVTICNNLSYDFIHALRSTSNNTIETFVAMTEQVYSNLITPESDGVINTPDSITKYINYLKLKRKV